MSGHSKWANIKRQKEVNDKARGNVFAKLSRIITLAVLEGGGITNPDNNVKLRLAIEKAHQANMPKDNIKRAIEKGVGPDKAILKEAIVEGFAPGGVAMIILATTDNLNRTISEIRNVLERHQGKMAGGASVSYLFQKCASISFNKTEKTEDQVFELAEQLNAFDIISDDTHFTVYFPYENLGRVKGAEVDYRPFTPVILNDVDMRKLSLLVDDLENLDDVHKVFVNLQ